MVKHLPANVGDASSIPGSGSSPGIGNGNPLQYSCLGIPWTEEPLEGYSPWACKRFGHNWATKQQQRHTLAWDFEKRVKQCTNLSAACGHSQEPIPGVGMEEFALLSWEAFIRQWSSYPLIWKGNPEQLSSGASAMANQSEENILKAPGKRCCNFSEQSNIIAWIRRTHKTFGQFFWAKP